MTVFDPFELMLHFPNHFGFGGLDRDSLNRENNDFVGLILRDKFTRLVPIWRSKNLFYKCGDDIVKPEPLFLKPNEFKEILKISNDFVYLGKHNLEGKKFSYLAIDISDLDEVKAKNNLPKKAKFADLREISPLIDGIEGSILAYARAMLFWHSRNRFCSVCGTNTFSTKAGHQRNCSSTVCNSLHFPRIDPAVIMLVQDNKKILLGRQKVWPSGLYSTLAGFVEPGETIEHAVAREVFEESGLIVKNVIYKYSQPWPFPSSLMLGFTAEANTNRISFNDFEIEDAQWFSKEDILNFEKNKKFLPRKLSVSRRLIEDWLNGYL